MYEFFGIIGVILLWTLGLTNSLISAVALLAVMIWASCRRNSRARFNASEWRAPASDEAIERYAAALDDITILRDLNESFRSRIEELESQLDNAHADNDQVCVEAAAMARRHVLDLYDIDKAAFAAMAEARRQERHRPYPGWHRVDPSPDHWTDATAWWQVFDVAPNASLKLVRQAYHDLVRRYHPDNKDTGRVDWMQKINNAWDTFKNNPAHRT